MAVSCRVLKLVRAPYYRWLREPVGPAGQLRQQRVRALRDAHQDDPEFGYRLLADEARQMGFPMVDRTAWRLCNQSGIMSAIVRTRKRRGKKPGPPVCDDLVRRDSSHGGGWGIRTPEGLHPTRFPSVRHRPLGESS